MNPLHAALVLLLCLTVLASVSGVAAEENTPGTLERMSLADVVEMAGNPLSDIHATEEPVFVMKIGIIDKGQSAKTL